VSKPLHILGVKASFFLPRGPAFNELNLKRIQNFLLSLFSNSIYPVEASHQRLYVGEADCLVKGAVEGKSSSLFMLGTWLFQAQLDSSRFKKDMDPKMHMLCQHASMDFHPSAICIAGMENSGRSSMVLGNEKVGHSFSLTESCMPISAAGICYRVYSC
jgi:hypothetical protein